MKKRKQRIASILISVFIVSIGIVHGQTPASRHTTNISEVELTSLLAKGHRARSSFSLMTSGRAVNSTGLAFSNTAMAVGSNLTVLGSGTLGRVTKWTGFTSSNSFVGDSNMFEDKFGLVGIGTTAPTSLLTVQGMIEITLGGLKFPDGTVQTTAALSSIFHDASLMGSGTQASPLGIANGGVQPIHLRMGLPCAVSTA